jgi:hypothetical protein
LRYEKHQIAELEKAAEKEIAELKTRETIAIWKAEDAKLKATAASQDEESAKRNEREVRGLLDAAVAGLER